MKRSAAGVASCTPTSKNHLTASPYSFSWSIVCPAPTGRSWDPVVAALSERYRALAPDIRGHGTASQAQPVTLEAVIGDVAGAGGEAFTLAGYSMGARIALHAALALHHRVERLVLVGASPGIADQAERSARREADERLADETEKLSIQEFARQWASNPVLADQPPTVRAAAA